MSAALPESGLFLTREEYYLWCDKQPRGRFERIDGQIVAMAAERGAHLRVKSQVFLELRRAIVAAGVDCQALPDGAAVPTGNNDFEPDALVNCGSPMGDDEIVAPNPVVVVEVISPSTQTVDLMQKLAGYFQVPSIVHYLIVHPTRRIVVHHRRTADGIATAIIPEGTLALDPPGITVLVDNFYTDTSAAP